MIIDDAGNVIMTRGDTEEFTVNFTQRDPSDPEQFIPVVLEEGTVVVLTARDRKTEERIFHVDGVVDGSSAEFLVRPEDTQDAEAGKYFYDIEVTRPGELRKTPVGGAETGKLTWELVRDETRHD